MKTFKKILKWAGILLLLVAIAGGFFFFRYIKPFMNRMKESSEIIFDKNLKIVLGGGGNTGIFTSDSLVVVIDTKMDEAADKLHEEVMKLAGTKKVIVINTHFHPDHCGGNNLYKGATIIAGANYGEATWTKEVNKESLPNQWLKDKMDIYLDDDTLTIINLAKDVHTQSDIIVYAHRRKILFTGDVVLNKQAPVLMGKANAAGYLFEFKELPELFAIEALVPGHGKLGGIEIIGSFKQYFDDMKTASMDDSQKDVLVAKYDDWNQIPFLMSPGATISYFKKHP